MVEAELILHFEGTHDLTSPLPVSRPEQYWIAADANASPGVFHIGASANYDALARGCWALLALGDSSPMCLSESRELHICPT